MSGRHADNERLAHRFLAALRASDREELLRVFDPDLVWLVPAGAIPPYAGEHRGAERVASLMLGAVSGAFLPGSIRHHVRLVLGDARHVMIELEMEARTPDGRDYRNAYVFVLEIAKGRIRTLREHVDTTTAARFFAGPGADSHA